MKFYVDKNTNSYLSFLKKIVSNKLKAICYDEFDCSVRFYLNGMWHNPKNAAYFDGKNKNFSLNGKVYSTEKNFTKQSWRRFVKLKAFL
jgi:hypothetical protein